MTRADGYASRVHYKGKKDDYIIIAEDVEMVQKWKADKSTPLAQVVNSFDIFHTDNHGAQGKLNRASKQQLHEEFDTEKEEEIVAIILEKGELQVTQAKGKQGDRNTMNGPQGQGQGVHN